MQCIHGMRAVLGMILMVSATAVAQPTGPSGDAQPIDPYGSDSSAAPAPSQQQAPAQAPAPNTVPDRDKPQPPASEQKPLPPIDKPAPAPVDQPAPVPVDRPAQSGPAPAAPEPTSAPPPRPTIDVASAPAACREAGNRVSSRDHNSALQAKISFALCTANAAVADLTLVDAEASVHEVDHATANAFGLLDEVAAAGDPRWQIVALHAEGDLLTTMTRRMHDTVPPAGAGATPAAVALHDSRLQLLQAHLQPWLERAQHAFEQVDQLARENPQLANSPLVANAVADSRRRLTNGVATR